MRSLLICGFLCLGAAGAWGQTPAEPQRAADLREEVQYINATTQDLNGKPAAGQIPVTIYRPPGNGPFPLVIMNHGRPTQEKRGQLSRQRYENLSRYLVAKGFVVLIPTRLGYAETYGQFDPEYSGGCVRMQPGAVAAAASDQVLQTLEFARGLPYVNADRWVVMGQSVGGLAAVATVGRHPPGLVAGINFAGGTGGDPENREGQPCSPQTIESLLTSKGAQAKVPMLWLYWANDKYWGAEQPVRWHKAWTAGGGKAEFHSLPAFGNDGHVGMANNMNAWVPLAEDFLARAGFSQPGTVSIPARGGFAALEDAGKVPVSKSSQAGTYVRFLEGKKPRAYAIGLNGVNGWATGDWAPGRALGFCQARSSTVCKLYAVDDDVVWQP